MTETATEIERATQTLLGLQLWLVHYHKPKRFEDLKPHLQDHFAYAQSLERSGLLFGAGPIRTPEGEMEGRGLFVVRARDRAHAEQIAADDPMVQAGVRAFTVEHWTVNMGTLDVRLRYSDQSFALAGATQ